MTAETLMSLLGAKIPVDHSGPWLYRARVQWRPLEGGGCPLVANRNGDTKSPELLDLLLTGLRIASSQT